MQPTDNTHTKGFISIRWTIPLFMIAPLMVGIGLTGWLAFRSGQKAINELGTELGSRMSMLIEQRIENYLSRPRKIQQSVVAAVQGGSLDPNNLETVRRYFWHLVQTPNLVDMIYLGDQQGNFVGLSEQQGVMVAEMRTPATAPNWEIYRLDDQGNIAETIDREEYDPRQRPWYQAVVASGSAAWSEVYIGASSSQLELTWATPVKAADGRLLGVLGSDLSLAQISNFLRDLKISPSSQAFIVEKSGYLVATSTPEDPYKMQGNEKVRLPAEEIENDLVRSTSEYLLSSFNSFARVPSSEPQEYKLNGDRILVRSFSLQEDLGLDWLIVVAIPEKDFMGTVHANTRMTLLVGGAITAIASLIGLLVALRITRPIGQLSQAARKIQANDFEPNSLDSLMARPDEFGELAKLFHDMASVIISREQSLAEQVEALRSEINKSSNLSQSELNDLKTLVKRSRQTRGEL